MRSAKRAESRLVIGTAGHVDHGKTTLIRALTGHDTDRLPEEKSRGISIELGFAPFVLPSGAGAAVVDVPGHERFVHHMLAGAQGMDVVLLVVAADEGVMPQTREHLDILTLLGVEQGIVCLTKIDLVEPEWRQMVVQDLQRELSGSFLENAPIVAISPVTGEGMTSLLEMLDRLVLEVRPRSASGPVRLPVDRVFSVAGFGTVVTGTLASGRIALEDRLELVPGGRMVRVRSLQSHGEAVEALRAGQRTAVNLAGVDRAEVQRGQVLATPGSVSETVRVTLHVHLLPSATPLEQRDRVRLHIGTTEAIGRVTVLDGQAIAPGGAGFVRFLGEAPFPAAARDRVVLRTFSPPHTVGGGIVLDTQGSQRRGRTEDLETLGRRLEASPDEVLLGELRRAFALRIADVRGRLGVSAEEAAQIAGRLVERAEILRIGELLIHAEELFARVDGTEANMRDMWTKDVLWRGLDRDAWRRLAAPELDGKAAGALLHELQQRSLVRLEGEHVLPQMPAPELPLELETELQDLHAFLLAGGLQPPAARDWPGAASRSQDRMEAMLAHLQARGSVLRLSDIWFAAAPLADAERMVREALSGGRGATTARLRETLGTTRKFAVPILEHLDQRRITRRQGDERYLFGA